MRQRWLSVRFDRKERTRSRHGMDSQARLARVEPQPATGRGEVRRPRRAT